MNTHYCI